MISSTLPQTSFVNSPLPYLFTLKIPTKKINIHFVNSLTIYSDLIQHASNWQVFLEVAVKKKHWWKWSKRRKRENHVCFCILFLKFKAKKRNFEERSKEFKFNFIWRHKAEQFKNIFQVRKINHFTIHIEIHFTFSMLRRGHTTKSA